MRIFIVALVLCGVAYKYVNAKRPSTKLTSKKTYTVEEYVALKKQSGGRLKYSQRHIKILDNDVILTPGQYDSLYEKKKRRRGRMKYKALREARMMWTNGIVPYKIVENKFSEDQIIEIRHAMNTISQFTCITFLQANDNHRSYVQFTDNGDGCYSALGMQRGRQVINLGEGCKHFGTYLHEIGHALGLIHEHQRPDRDEHIKVIWRRVKRSKLSNFNKYTNTTVNNFQVDYDFSSVMHYGPRSFNDDGEYTMIPMEGWRVDQMIPAYYKTLSYTDTKILNKMYKCAKDCDENIQCEGEAYLDSNCDCITPQSIYDALCVNEAPEDWCYDRVKRGECESNAGVMSFHCRRACGFCPSYGIANFTQRLMEPLDRCTDRYHEPERCVEWAADGECETNESWMKRFCRQSCNACDWDKGKCRNYDDNVKCDRLAAEGSCTDDNPKILVACQDSCNVCGYQIPGDCLDGNQETCPNQARSGDCDSTNMTLAINTQTTCRKSCNTCSIGAGDCQDQRSTNACQEAAVKGKCRLEPTVYMNECRHTCDSCSYNVTDQDCSDILPLWDCSWYREQGLCREQEYRGEAFHFCASSCNQCNFFQNTPCEDIFDNCADLSAAGKCVTDHPSTSVNCAQTCDKCNRYRNGACANREHDVYCTVNSFLCADPDFADNCRLTCGQCRGDPPNIGPGCQDLAPLNECVRRSRRGECETNRIFMSAFCETTCGRC